MHTKHFWILYKMYAILLVFSICKTMLKLKVLTLSLQQCWSEKPLHSLQSLPNSYEVLWYSFRHIYILCCGKLYVTTSERIRMVPFPGLKGPVFSLSFRKSFHSWKWLCTFIWKVHIKNLCDLFTLRLPKFDLLSTQAMYCLTFFGSPCVRYILLQAIPAQLSLAHNAIATYSVRIWTFYAIKFGEQIELCRSLAGKHTCHSNVSENAWIVLATKSYFII